MPEARFRIKRYDPEEDAGSRWEDFTIPYDSSLTVLEGLFYVQEHLDGPVDCILCGACYSSCPSVWGEGNYLGPHALYKAYRFEVDSRDEAGRERLPTFDNERGSYRCHTIMNCVEACPKELSPSEGIQWLKGAAVRRRLFGSRK